MIEIRVEVSKWTDGSGFDYTTGIDPMEIPSISELKKYAKEYVEDWMENETLAEGEDLKFNFYAPDDEEPSETVWASDVK